jgi:hypothetical protein
MPAPANSMSRHRSGRVKTEGCRDGWTSHPAPSAGSCACPAAPIMHTPIARAANATARFRIF